MTSGDLGTICHQMKHTPSTLLSPTFTIHIDNSVHESLDLPRGETVVFPSLIYSLHLRNNLKAEH